MSNSDWKDCYWGDIAILEYGKSCRTYADSIGQYSVFGTNGIIGKHIEPLCQHPGVIIGRKGAYRGVHYSKQPFWVIDTAFYLERKTNIDLKWAYYNLLTQDINGMDSGSAIPSTSRQDFYALPVKLPPLSEQKAIAHILGTLDDKIELNQQMNQTLEAIAKAIFKSWFVDFDPVRAKMEGRQPVGMDAATAELFPDSFEESALGLIPKGWVIKALAELIDIKHGYAFKGEFFTTEPSGDILLTPGNFAIGGGFKDDKFKYYFGEVPKEFILKKDDLLVSMTDLSKQSDTLGYPVLLPKEGEFRYLHNQRLGKIIIKSNMLVGKLYLYYLLRTAAYRHEILASATGTTVKHTSPERIKAFEFTCPENKIAFKFERIVTPFYDKYCSNCEELSTLKILRDTLLPKLMSGETRVKEAQTMIEEVV